MSLQGIRTIAVLELRQRLRTSRWPVVLGVWFLIIGVVAGLTWWAVHDQRTDRGTTLYDVVLFFVLGLGMLVVPSLTATSINGDRQEGVLATLQTTLLTSADIVLGKLLAAWAISIAFLLAASPFLVWAWIAGGIDVGRMLLAVAVLTFVLAMICALGLMFSALTARTISSAVLTYLAVAALTFGTVISFLISMPILATQQSVRVKVLPDNWYETHAPTNTQVNPEPTAADCVYITRTQSALHTERTWWLLALNPFVVVADAAPSRKTVSYLGFEPLSAISDGARAARAGITPDENSLNECWPEVQPSATVKGAPLVQEDVHQQEQLQEQQQTHQQQVERERLSKVHAVWPYGFAFLGLLGAGSTWVAIRRLRTPIRKLPRGTRIA
jgi:ABC-type transport system involved in multi-copper enzyme maturation permease subunit